MMFRRLAIIISSSWYTLPQGLHCMDSLPPRPYAACAMLERKRSTARAKNSPPTAPTIRNCGHTTSKPPPPPRPLLGLVERSLRQRLGDIGYSFELRELAKLPLLRLGERNANREDRQRSVHRKHKLHGSVDRAIGDLGSVRCYQNVPHSRFFLE